MPTKPRSGVKSLYVELPEAIDKALRALADGNGRGVKDELLHAIERHLAAPPVVRVETPAMPAAVIDPAPARPAARPRGRPRKQP